MFRPCAGWTSTKLTTQSIIHVDTMCSTTWPTIKTYYILGNFSNFTWKLSKSVLLSAVSVMVVKATLIFLNLCVDRTWLPAFTCRILYMVYITCYHCVQLGYSTIDLHTTFIHWYFITLQHLPLHIWIPEYATKTSGALKRYQTETVDQNWQVHNSCLTVHNLQPCLFYGWI